MTENEYRGMRNPYHLYDLLKKTKTEWKNVDPAKRKQKLNELKAMYKKGQANIENLFDPKGTLDQNGNWITGPSPLYPFVEQWWDN